MGVRKKFYRVVALLLIPMLLVETVWSAPASGVPSVAAAPAISFPLDDAFVDPLFLTDSLLENPPQVPFEYGETVESFNGHEPYRVFVIQDAHALPQAQRTTSKILDYWASQIGLRLVGLEGAEGDLPHTAVSSFPNATARQMFADSLLEEAVIGGPEYLQLTQYPSLKLYGVEESSLYASDREAFLKVLNSREKSLSLLEQMRASSDDLALKVLPVEFLRFRKHNRMAHEQGQWKEYLESLQAMRLKSHVQSDYPAFDFWMTAHSLIEKVNPEILSRETELISKKGKLGALLSHYGKQLINGIDPEKNIRVEAALWKESYPWLQEFPHLVSALKASYLMRRIGTTLFEEVSRLEKELSDVMCPEPQQKEIVRRLQNLDIAHALISLSLTASNYEDFLSRASELKAVALAEKNGVEISVEEQSHLTQTFEAAKEFYQIAVNRDEALAKNFMRKMSRENLKVGALVVGGFHTAGLLRVFRESGVSYQVVRPKIHDANSSSYQALYEKRMVSQESRLEWAKPALGDNLLADSYAQLQLQSPRRSGVDFFKNLFFWVRGTSEVLTRQPVLSRQILKSAAPFMASQQRALLQAVLPEQTRAELRVSPDGKSIVSVMPESGLLIAHGPQAKSLAGEKAVKVKGINPGQDVWIGGDAMSTKPLWSGWELVEPEGSEVRARSEVRLEDSLAQATWKLDLGLLQVPGNFEKAIAVRLGAFSDVLKISDRTTQTVLDVGGIHMEYRYNANSRSVEVVKVSSDWANGLSVEGKALALIYLEEYLSMMVMLPYQRAQPYALADRVVERFIERAEKLGLLQSFIGMESPQVMKNFWGNLIFSSAKKYLETNRSFDKVSLHVRSLVAGKLNQQEELTSAAWGQLQSQLSQIVRSTRQRVQDQTSYPDSLHPDSLNGVSEFLLFYLKQRFDTEEADGEPFVLGVNGNTTLVSLPQEVEIILLEDETEVPDAAVFSDDAHGNSLSDEIFAEYLRTEGFPDLDTLSALIMRENLNRLGDDRKAEEFDKLYQIFNRLEALRETSPEKFSSYNDAVLFYMETLLDGMRKIRETIPDKIVEEMQLVDPDEIPFDLPEGVTASSVKHPVSNNWIIPVMEVFLAITAIAAVIYFSLPLAGFLVVPSFLAAVLPPMLLSPGLAVFYTFLALMVVRAAYVAGTILNEWGHLIVAGFTGKTDTVKMLRNWTGNRNIFVFLWALIPFIGPIPSAFIELHEYDRDEDTIDRDITTIRKMGFYVGSMALTSVLVVVALVGASFIPPLAILLLNAGGIISVIAAFISDIVFPPVAKWVAACGNTSIMGRVTKPGDLEKYLARLKKSIVVTEKRGKIAIGFGAFFEDADGNQSYIRAQYYIDSRQAAAEVFEKKFKPLVLRQTRGMKLPYYIHIGDHLRFPTAGAKKGDFSVTATENGAHPHPWVGEREVQVLTKTSTGWAYVTKKVLTILGHNGDFNDLVKNFVDGIKDLLFRTRRDGHDVVFKDKKYTNQQIAWAMKRIKGVYNPTTGDSPKLAGVQDLVYTQGRWADSVQFAHYAAVAPDLEYYFGGSIPKNDREEQVAANNALTQDEVQKLAAYLESSFAKAGGLERIKQLNDLADISDADLMSLQREVVKQMMNLVGTPFVQWDAKFGEGTSQRFIETAVYAFLRHNLRNTWIYIAPNVRGSAGVNAYSSLEPRTKVSFSLGQNITVGYGRIDGVLQVGSNSEANAGRVDGYEVLYDLNGLGEVSEIRHDGEVIEPRIYSLTEKDGTGAHGRFLTPQEIHARMRRVTPIKVPEADDQAEAEMAKISRDLKRARDGFRDPRSIRSPEMPSYTRENHNFFITQEILKAAVAAPVSRLILDQSRSGLEGGLGDDVFTQWADATADQFLAQLGITSPSDAQRDSVRNLLIKAFRREISNSLANAEVARQFVKPFGLEVAEEHLKSRNSQEPISVQTIQGAVQKLFGELLKHSELPVYRDFAIQRLLSDGNKQKLAKALKKGIPLSVVEEWSFLPLSDKMPDDGYDIVFFGKEKNEQILITVEQILRKIYPSLRVRVYDSNVINKEANTHLRDRADASQFLEPGDMDIEGFKRQLNLTNPFVLAFASSGSGQHFNSSTGVLTLARIVDELFVITSDEYSQMSRAVGPERTLIIPTDWTPTELGSGAYSSTRAVFVEFIFSMMKNLPLEIAGKRLFESDFTNEDVDFLEREWDYFIDQTAPIIFGQKTDEEGTHETLIKEGRSIGRRIIEGVVVTVAAWTYILLTVGGSSVGLSVPTAFTFLHSSALSILAAVSITPLVFFISAVGVLAGVLFTVALIKHMKKDLYSGKTRDFIKAAVWTLAGAFLLAQILFLPGIGDALFYIFFAFPIVGLAYRIVVKMFDKNSRSIFDRGGMKLFSFVSVQEEPAKILETFFRKSFSQSYGLNGAHADSASTDRFLDQQIGGMRGWINIGLLNKSGVAVLDDDNEATLMVFKQLITILSQVLFPYSYLFGFPLVGGHNVLIGDAGSQNEKASQQHISIETSTRGQIAKGRLAQQLYGLKVDDFRLVLVGYVLIHSIAKYVSTHSLILNFNPNNTRSGAGTHTTASPRGADVLLSHLQVMDVTLRQIKIPGLEPELIELPDYVRFPESAQYGHSQGIEKPNPRAEAMDRAIEEAEQKLKEAHIAYIEHRESQLETVVQLINDFSDESDSKPIYRYAGYLYAELARHSRVLNGMETELSKPYASNLIRLPSRIGYDEKDPRNTGFREVFSEEEGLEFFQRLQGNSFQFIVEVGQTIRARRNELRESSSDFRSEQRNEDGVVQGLTAQGAMRSGSFLDQTRAKMRKLFALPDEELHRAAAAKLGRQVSDVGTVVLERPYSIQWIRQFIAKLPSGVHVVLRAPTEADFPDHVRYSRELTGERFSIEFSSARSEDWLEKYYADRFDRALDPSTVIQIESPKDPEAEDTEMLLLAAPMAPGHVLILGQSKKLQLPGMRWYQISVWVNQLYDAVMATQISA